MAEEKEAMKAMWNGKVPITLCLAEQDLSNVPDTPEPFYHMAPRVGYFPVVLEKAIKYFAKYANSSDGDPWLEYKDQPLSWHYPVGVLFDLHTGGRAEPALPWALTLHFSSYPAEELLPGPTREAAEAHFMSCLKEADALKHKSQVMNSMQKRDHKQLWTGLTSGRFESFWSVNKRLMDHDGADVNGGFRHVPFRIYRLDHGFVQALVRPQHEDGSDVTLKELLVESLGTTCRDGQSGGGGGENLSEDQVLVTGIHVPLVTPVAWLSDHMSYPDNFLHIVVLS